MGLLQAGGCEASAAQKRKEWSLREGLTAARVGGLLAVALTHPVTALATCWPVNRCRSHLPTMSEVFRVLIAIRAVANLINC